MKTLILFLEIIWFILVIFYLYLFFYRNQIETSITFVWMGDTTNYDYTKDGFEEINLKNENKENIHGIFLDKKMPKTIYYFHGNGGALYNYLDDIKYLANFGYNIMAYDYPGYGRSSWYPREEKVYEFTKTFFEYIKEKKWLKNEDIISYGHSVGTALASDFSYHFSPSKTILISPLCSRYEMSIAKYGFVLQKILFMKNSFDTCSKVKSFSTPLLIVHGTTDEVIPFSHGQKVFSNAISKKKYFITLENFWHNGILQEYKEKLTPILKVFLESSLWENISL